MSSADNTPIDPTAAFELGLEMNVINGQPNVRIATSNKNWVGFELDLQVVCVSIGSDQDPQTPQLENSAAVDGFKIIFEDECSNTLITEASTDQSLYTAIVFDDFLMPFSLST